MKKIAVIDPGHGAHDPGAISVFDEVTEKELALEYSLKCLQKESIYNDFGISMTRYGDVYIKPSDRATFANKIKANLFVSIHFNASEYNNAKGTEVLIYPKPSRNNGNFGSLEGRRFARCLLGEVNRKVPNLRVRGIKPGYFRGDSRRPILTVLRKTQCPAVVWEIGFLSNLEDSILVCNEYMKFTLSTVLMNSIKTYFDGGTT